MNITSNSFSHTLLSWHDGIDRHLPWKEENDVFYIWLSEIILQQTRVEQGIPYYLKFKKRFSSVQELAEVSDRELMKMWEGLGYYSRARNLHAAAKQIVEQGGEFPKTYKGLLALKGVGPYTAAAIGSFAYGLPIPVIDGNVKRVISRIFGIHDAIDGREGMSKIELALEKIFKKQSPAEFNQAIMDFGALQCTPKSPDCSSCPFSMDCHAFANDEVSILPYKAKKIIKKNRDFHYIILSCGEDILIRKRVEKDIWRHLHEFIKIEQKDISPEQINAILNDISPGIKYTYLYKSSDYTHVLTHQKLKIIFHHVETNNLQLKKGREYFLVDRKNLWNFGFPKIIDWYLKDKSISLEKVIN